MRSDTINGPVIDYLGLQNGRLRGGGGQVKFYPYLLLLLLSPSHAEEG